jgi:hypothetical protein
MKTTSYTQLPTYEVSGSYLNIYWNEEAHPPREDETEPYWSYDFCQARTIDSRSALIEKIIATQYPTYGSEVAAIRNGGEAAEKHEALRVLAKELADGWFARASQEN